mgnify:CR=1 FL=1
MIQDIHQKMKTLLGKEGVYFDDVMFCPHHPDKGYPEENPIYKVSCSCRKPEIGLLEKCEEKYHIDLINHSESLLLFFSFFLLFLYLLYIP